MELVNAKEDGGRHPARRPRSAPASGHGSHPHKADGTVTYTKLDGDVTFDDVDFGYDENKIVLHNIKLYATPGQKIAFRGQHRRGQDHDHQPDQPLLRHRRTERSATTASTSTRSRRPTCAAPSAWCFRTPTCLPGRLWTISATGGWTPPTSECIAAAKLANADGFITPSARRLQHRC